MDNINKLTEEYNKLRPTYVSITDKVVLLLRELIKHDSIDIHNIEGRAKDVESFKFKIQRKSNKYLDPLKEITDLSGIRIITYYQDDVEKVETLLKREFIIDKENSLDKGKLLNSNEFGYRSVHYVLSLSEDRLKLPEWSKYKEIKIEVQIRTVLQHSWASISHSLQYKHEDDVPAELKRKLYRLAGLFELADEEYMDVRNRNKLIMTEIVATSSESSMNFEINLLTLSNYIDNSPEVKKLIESSEKAGFSYGQYELEGNEGEQETISSLIKLCKIVRINTLGELSYLIENNLAISIKMYKSLMGPNYWEISPAFAIVLLVIYTFSDEFTEEILIYNGWSREIARRTLLKISKNKS
jgi:ppGpp synthetase/RelA/SpoT-type nucleotidyltranferase